MFSHVKTLPSAHAAPCSGFSGLCARALFSALAAAAFACAVHASGLEEGGQAPFDTTPDAAAFDTHERVPAPAAQAAAPAAPAVFSDKSSSLDAGEEPARPLARDHVNLVRVKGDKITDVVFDAQALEISADKERGIVFVRVRPAWLAAHPGRAAVTSAFFNTATENHAVRFAAADVPSQTIDLAPGLAAAKSLSDTPALQALQEALAAPSASLAAEDFIGQLKEIVRETAADKSAKEPAAVGLAFSSDTARVRPVDVSSLARTHWEGFSVRPVRAWVSESFVCEELFFTNLNTSRRTLELNSLAQSVTGVAAIGAESVDFAPGEGGTILVIRSRNKLGLMPEASRAAASGDEAPVVFTSEALGAADDAGKK